MPSAVQGVSSLDELQSLYGEHRYLEVWQATAERWHPSTDLDRLSKEELIFAGRLALRLGGPRLARSLFRRARRLAPSDPHVRYFTQYLWVPRELLLDELAAFEANPDLGGEDRAIRAHWLALYATLWARLRNLPRAHDLIRQAHALLPDDAWLYSQEAEVWGAAEDWPAAQRAAEQALALDSRAPWALLHLAHALLNNGQVERAVERIAEASRDTQSTDILQAACWYHCAWADLMPGEPRRRSLAQARASAESLERLAPLADREFKAGLARIRLDIATLEEDHAEIERWAHVARSAFHRQVLTNLKRNPDGRSIRLPYRRALQKYNECVPTSVGSALSASDIEVSISDFAADVTYGGTAEWAAADWLRGRNLHVRFFSATAETAWQLLQAGIGFMVTCPDDDGGHAVAIVGMDQAAGIVLAHDPTSFRTAEYLVQAFDRSQSPYGVLGMAAVQLDRAAVLDDLLPADAAIVEAAQAQQRALALYGPSSARAAIDGVLAQFPDHPGVRELLAIQDSGEGRTGQALAVFRSLYRDFPQAPRVRSNLIGASRALGNTALLRETLRSIAETGSVPGVSAETEWIRPHPLYVTEYADLLRQSTATRHEAELLLRSVLRTHGSSAYAWHVLADLRWDRQRRGEALLAYSIASFLAPHNEHYARAYGDVLLHQGRAEVGLAWLEDRTQRLGRSLQGVGAWTTWIDALEDWGFPERALAAYLQAAERHPASISLMSFAVPFLARMAHWDRARAQLEALAASEGRGAYHNAAVDFHRMRGEPHLALEHAHAWVAELPRSMAARHAVLSLLRTLAGNAAALTCAERWLREHPANEEFEDAFCQYAQDGARWRKLRVLLLRLRRNAEDGWAWRELLFAALALFDLGDARRRQRMTPRIEAWFAAAQRVGRGHASLLRAQALWLENRGEWHAAVEAYREAIQRDPENFFSYRRAWECATRLLPAMRRELWTVIEPYFLSSPRRLHSVGEMVGLLAGRFGVPETEAIVDRWRERRPDDPNVLEAAADLLLEHGHGQAAKRRALAIAQDGVKRFPAHARLHFLWASALREAGSFAEAQQVYRELVERRPNDVPALFALAWIEHREGNTAQALETLERARKQVPLDPRPLHEQARILIDAGRPEDALAVVERMLNRIPESVQTYEWAIGHFRRCGRPADAVRAARRGTEVYPAGAYLWLLLARTLREHPDYAAAGEVEACLRRSLKFNATLFESADWLAVHLVEQHRYDEAAALLRDLERYLPDPSPAQGRLAWIRRRRGEKSAAIVDLDETLNLVPGYAWGWHRLLDWLAEDKDKTRILQLLATIPPAMLGNLEFRRRRLELLDTFGSDTSVVEAEWQALLSDSPDDIPLHLRRFDALQKAKRLPEAAEVLRALLPAAKDNLYLRARMVDIHLAEKAFDAGMEEALAVCFAAGAESDWPAQHVWAAMRNAGLIQQFLEGFASRLQPGAQPAAAALSLYAEDLVGRIADTHLPKWFSRSPLSPAMRRLQRFIRLLERSSWVQPAHIAELMKVLSEGKHLRLAVACWHRLRRQGLDRDTGAWAQAGYALVNLKKMREARATLADWRTRQGVQMWMLANYLIALPRLAPASRREVIATSREALATLAHDHSARYLAYMAAEASAMSRDKQALLELWERYPACFEQSPKTDEFFPVWQRYLIAEIPIAVRLLTQPKPAAYYGVLFTLYTKRLWHPATRVRWRSLFILLVRILIAAAIGSQAIMQLFR